MQMYETEHGSEHGLIMESCQASPKMTLQYTVMFVHFGGD